MRSDRRTTLGQPWFPGAAGLFMVLVLGACSAQTPAAERTGVSAEVLTASCESTLQAGLVAWYRAEGNARDSAGGSDGTTVGGVTYGPGEAGQAFSFDGSTGAVELPDLPTISGGQRRSPRGSTARRLWGARAGSWGRTFAPSSW
jgi:hypothetical protein